MIRIVGDTCFSDSDFDQGFGIGSQLKNNNDILSQISKNQGDIWLGNLECVVSDTTENKTGVNNFRISEEEFLKSTQLDIYSVANNHSMQHGHEAFRNTLTAVEKVGKHVGSVDQKHIIINHKDTTYGIISFSLRNEVFYNPALYWLSPDFSEIESEYDQIKKTQVKIAYIHWGNEFINYPNVEQKRFAHLLIDIGFDLIIGTHPHVLQGYEVYKGKYIFYSIGNFLFNMSSQSTKFSVVVNVDYLNNIKVSYDYIYIKNGIPDFVSVESVPTEYRFETINSLIYLTDDNEIYYAKMFKERAKYQIENRLWILKTLHKHKFSDIVEIVTSFIKRKIKI